MSHDCGLHCLKMEHLEVHKGGEIILEDVNLHAHCGELTAIIGRNGAGKSTLLKAILGEIRHSGTVTFTGHNGAPTPHKPRIGYVPQNINVDAGTPATVQDIALAYTTRLPAFFPHRKKTIAALAGHFARFGAEELLDKPAGTLSGGEQQRMLLALATTEKPDLLILDEPASGIDTDGLQKIYALLDELRKEDMLILMVSHDLPYVYGNADRVLLLDRTVRACGTPQEVFDSPAFLDAFPAAKGGVC